MHHSYWPASPSPRPTQQLSCSSKIFSAIPYTRRIHLLARHALGRTRIASVWDRVRKLTAISSTEYARAGCPYLKKASSTAHGHVIRRCPLDSEARGGNGVVSQKCTSQAHNVDRILVRSSSFARHGFPSNVLRIALPGLHCACMKYLGCVAGENPCGAFQWHIHSRCGTWILRGVTLHNISKVHFSVVK